MKTLKKIFTLLVCLCFCGILLSSCKDKEDDSADPKISYIIPTDAAKQDSLIVGANAGDYVIIVGENLSSVVMVLFDNVPATLNSSYKTDNSIILQIPEISASTKQIILVTKNGKYFVNNFTIDIPPPVINMFYCEFVPAGKILRVKGNYFFDPKVYFYGEDGALIPADNVDTKDSKEIFVTVPGGVGYSKPIVVQTGSGKAESKILFRDRRNIIIDFDEYKATVSGTMDPQEGAASVDNVKPKWKNDPELLKLLPKGFELPEGCDGLYDQINFIDDMAEGNYIAYQVEKGGRVPQKPLIGGFGNYEIKDLVLKFEVFVPKEYPINGIYADICFPPKGNNGQYAGGRDLTAKTDETCVPGAWWCPFEADIDKSDPKSWRWKVGSNCKEPFYTDWKELSYTDKWMTVSVPLSSFIWNLRDRGINSIMEDNFAVNAEFPFTATNQRLEKDWNKAMGDFLFMWEPWATSGQNGVFLCFLDNFRVVPDDGGGVQFGKVGQRAYTGNVFTGGRPY